MLLSSDQHTQIWDRVYDELHFMPSVDPCVTPFVISAPHAVYAIRIADETHHARVAPLITRAFINCTVPGEKLYALDWQHSSFLFDPRDPRQMESEYVEDSRYFGGGYQAYFPPYLPDGDYYFFIDSQFRFGYLSHPWREEVWIFGDCLMAEFAKIHGQLGWTAKKSR